MRGGWTLGSAGVVAGKEKRNLVGLLHVVALGLVIAGGELKTV